MRLDPVGEVKNLNELDVEPVTIPIVSYDEDKNKVVTEIRFMRHVPLGFGIDMIKATKADGTIDPKYMVDFVLDCVVDEDQESFDDLIRRKDIFTEISTLRKVYDSLGEIYKGDNHPLEKPSSSSAGKPRTARTSKAVASNSASDRKRSA